MRGIMMLFTGFVLGFGVAIGLVGPFAPQSSEQQSVASAVQQPAERQPAAPPPSMGGADERFRIDARGHVETFAEIDGADMRVLVDTGATSIALRESDARRAGYRLSRSDYTVRVTTANGSTQAAPISLRSVEIGSIRVRNVPALVIPDDQLGTNLLGMSFLSQLRSFSFENGYLLLEN